MKGKSARVITTTGGSGFFYTITFNMPFLMFKYFFLKFCGFSPVKKTFFYSIRKIDKKRAEEIFYKVRLIAKKKI